MNDQFAVDRHMQAVQSGSRRGPGSIGFAPQPQPDAFTQLEADRPQRYGDMLGTGARMRHLFSQLRRLESSTMNLLIVGETGTGKELVARAVHEHSPVRSGPLVTVNCAALDRQLVRSELLGHEKGAFTGATQRHAGAFSAADGGTLFLDEIGELPLDVQPILLRVLESRKVTPVGSHVEHAVNVRLLSATHRNLRSEVDGGRFREDLYYRVQVGRLDIPPLRERPEDIPVLAEFMARRHGVAALPPDFMEAAARHRWPGNVRELRNAVEAYLALGSLPQSSARDLREIGAALVNFVDPTQTYAAQKHEILECFTRAYLGRVLEKAAGNRTEAARLSGLERTYLGRLVTKLERRQG
jgi:DNA-binding NtrC family response regulator